MKRLWIWISVALGAVVVVVAVGAETRGHAWCGWHGRHAGWGPGWYVAHELDLSNAQKKQIGAIWAGERPRVAGLVRELAAEQAQMRAATVEKNDGKVQEIAQQQGAVVGKLLMEKQRMFAEIYGSVLNAEQRIKADALQDKISERITKIADRLDQGGVHEN